MKDKNEQEFLDVQRRMQITQESLDSPGHNMKVPDDTHEGICMMCHKSPIRVRHINLYVIGSEGFLVCRTCENKVLDFIRAESRKATQETIKKWKEEKRGQNKMGSH